MSFDPKLKSPKEETLFPIMVVAASLIWFGLVVGTCGLGLFYVGVIGGVILIAHALFLAQVKGNGVRISEHQLSEIHARVRFAAERLGMQEIPEVFLHQSGGLLNAFATKLLSRRFVIIYSSLVDECSDPRQLDFVIGHELAHLAAGHLKWNAFLLPAKALPWLGAAYSRACEYTCDRAGHQVVGELEPSMRALAVLAAGGRLGKEVNLHAFLAQREETGGFWMAICELVSTHPFLCKRVAALHELRNPGSLKPVSRNPFAYLLAPFLGAGAGGAGAGGVMAFVAVMAILAAIAIPNFMKFQERAKAQARANQAQSERSAQQILDGLHGNDEAMQQLVKGLEKRSGADDAQADDSASQASDDGATDEETGGDTRPASGTAPSANP